MLTAYKEEQADEGERDGAVVVGDSEYALAQAEEEVQRDDQHGAAISGGNVERQGADEKPSRNRQVRGGEQDHGDPPGDESEDR